MTHIEPWAIEQHIKKNPKCEWLCTHSSKKNLGESPPEQQIEPTNFNERLDEILKSLTRKRSISESYNGIPNAVEDIKELFLEIIGEPEKQPEIDGDPYLGYALGYNKAIEDYSHQLRKAIGGDE